MAPVQPFAPLVRVLVWEHESDAGAPGSMGGDERLMLAIDLKLGGFRCEPERAAVLHVIPALQSVARRGRECVADHVQRPGGGGLGEFAPDPQFFRSLRAFRRSSGLRRCLRLRRLVGVTSTSSSGPMYSSANSSVICLGGGRISASSEPEARMFVRCLVLHTFTSRSSSRLFCPTTMP